MLQLNKRRIGDENIGKLIIFAFTIIMATALVVLINHFYTRSKVHTTNMQLLVSVKTKWDKLQYVQTEDGHFFGDNSTCGCNSDSTDNGRVIFNPVDNTFKIINITATDNGGSCLACFTRVRGVDYVSHTADEIEYIIK